MPTRDQVLSLYESTEDYETVGRDLGIWPGLAFMIATGMPADGSDSWTSDEMKRPGVLPGSSQYLVYRSSSPENPTTNDNVLRWLTRKAEADRPMRQAALARDGAPGEVVEPEQTDVSTVLTRDHDQVSNMLKQLKSIPGVTSGGSEVHQSRRASLVDMVTVALSTHEATEEEYFWPTVRKVLPDGDELADGALSQEQEGKEILTHLGSLSASDEDFDELVEKLDTACHRHVAYEDRVLLRLLEAMPQEDRRKLGEKIAKGEGRAPTRPHRHAPTAPVAAVKTAGAAAAAVDRMRDTAGKRPATRRGKAEQDLERARRTESQPKEGTAEP